MGYNKEFVQRMNEERKTYRDMIEFCCEDMVLNNYILQELYKKGFYFETYTGKDYYYTDEDGNTITEEEYQKKIDNGEEAYEQYEDIYQYYIISNCSAERLKDYTNEIVLYCEELDLNLLCVTHFGTAWDGVPANWKTPEEVEDDD